ncbi:CPBP family intramembrane metalloprotease [bacterium]|nr:MAG: CPBP family intramembrane metalloprotease [bacterium]
MNPILSCHSRCHGTAGRSLRQGTSKLFMNPSIPPISDPSSASKGSTAPELASRVALWRWWVATFIIGVCPALVSLLNGGRRADEKASAFPKTMPELLIFTLWEFGLFGIVWGVAWLFARASKDALFLRFKDGWLAPLWGVAYSIAMRLGITIFMVFVFVFLSLLGFDVMKISKTAEENSQVVQQMFAPMIENASPVFQGVMIFTVSFVVAGLREELWRVFTMAGLLRITPQRWNILDREVLALVLSSCLFGLGHIYQGISGVVLTTFLGVILGCITLHHKSIWPAVVAHGCFNAVSFISLAMLKK